MFENLTELIYLGMETKQSNQGTRYSVVSFGNQSAFEKYSFYADPNITVNVGVGALAKVTLKATLQRGFVNFICTGIDIAKA